MGVKESRNDADLTSWEKKIVESFGYLWGSDLEELSRAEVLTETVRRSEDFKVRKTAGFKVILVSFALLVPLGFSLVVPAEAQDFENFAANLAVFGFFGFLIGGGMMLWSALKWSPSDQPEWEPLYEKVHHALWREIEQKREELLSSGAYPALAHPPVPAPLGVSHIGAESLCAEWMRFLGETNVSVTSATADGGIDVVSSLSVAQVKNYSGSVGVAPMRELIGVASVDGRKPIFFTSGTYTEGAVNLANKAGVALFIYSAEGGTLDPANLIAKERLDRLGKERADSRKDSRVSQGVAAPDSSRVTTAAHDSLNDPSQHQQEGARVRPPTSPRVRSSPAHCPKCDYAPAPEEDRCSECGFYFLLNRF